MNKKFLPAYFLTFANTLGVSILFPVLPFIIADYNAPKWVFGLLISSYSIFQFIGSPYLGGMSDRLGRKPVLLISHAGTLLSWIIFLVALYLPHLEIYGVMIPLVIIGFARMMDGLTGGNTSVANAYVSDITTDKEKQYIFGYLGGISGIAMILGPGLGGFAASGSMGHIGTIVTAILISIATMWAIFGLLRESLPASKKSESVKEPFWRLLNIPQRLKTIKPNRQIKILFSMKMLFSAMMGCYIGAIALYVIDVFNFNESQMGTFMLVIGLFLAFNQAFVSKFFIKRLGEFKTLILGLVLSTIGLFSITMTTDLHPFIAFYYIMNLGLSLCFPTFNSLIAVHADEVHKGETLGISESIGSFNMALFPILSAALYSVLGGKVFHLVSCIPFVGLIIGLFYIKKFKTDHS